jgi:hypothetical protein
LSRASRYSVCSWSSSAASVLAKLSMLSTVIIAGVPSSFSNWFRLLHKHKKR